MDISKTIMYIIAGTIAVCTVLVVSLHGVSGLPFDWAGLVVAAVFFLISLAFTRIPGH